MNKCANCGAEFNGGVCPDCGEAAVENETSAAEESAQTVTAETAAMPAQQPAEEAAIVPPPRNRGQYYL